MLVEITDKDGLSECWLPSMNECGFEKPAELIRVAILPKEATEKFRKKYVERLLFRARCRKQYKGETLRLLVRCRQLDVKRLIIAGALKIGAQPVEIETEDKWTGIGFYTMFSGYKLLGASEELKRKRDKTKKAKPKSKRKKQRRAKN